MASLHENRANVEAIKARLSDPVAVARSLGLEKGAVRQAGGLLVCCPGHDDKTPSCSLTRPDGTLRVKCFTPGCLAGDIFTLVAAVERLDPQRDFRETLERAADLASVDLEADQPPATAPRKREPDRTYPEAAGVAALLGACILPSEDDEVSAWLRSRGLDPFAIDLLPDVRALPAAAAVPFWARHRGKDQKARPWTESGHRCISAMRDAHGVVRGVRARAVLPTDKPKDLPPGGHKAGELVYACPLMTQVLEAGAWPEWAERKTIVVVEGLPDFLTWATRWSDADERAPAVLGIVQGSWCDEIAGRVPTGSDLIVWTDADTAGEKYARLIQAALADRCRVLRGGGARGAAEAEGRQ